MRLLEQSSSRRRKGERWLPGAGEEGTGRAVVSFNGYRVSVREYEKVPVTDAVMGEQQYVSKTVPADN